MPPPPPPPIALFPPASAINLVSNTKLQNALNSAASRSPSAASARTSA